MALHVGLQLYSVRESLQRDPGGTLKEVANTGCRYIEAANHNASADPGVGFGLSAKEMKMRLDDLGLSIVGCHVHPWSAEALKPVLDYHGELGNNRIGCAMVFFPYGDRDFVMQTADAFNQVGELCREHGMQFYYHNHYHEFQEFDGRTVYDLLLENTEQELVFLELDTYWAFRGGQDPRALIEKHRDRLVLLHQKDFPQDAPQPLILYEDIVDPKQEIDMEVFANSVHPRCFTEIGAGILPIQDIVGAAAQAPHLDYIILEQDHSQLGEIQSVKVSMEALETFSGVTLA